MEVQGRGRIGAEGYSVGGRGGRCGEHGQTVKIKGHLRGSVAT